MASPCGKCNTCPCGTSGGAPQQQQQPSHRAPQPCGQPPQQQPLQQQPQPCGQPPQQHPQQHADSCAYPRAQGQPQGQGPAGCQVTSYQQRGNPTVECHCAQNRNRGAPPPIQADHVTCSRGPREQPPIMETRCNCKKVEPAVECHCPPPVPQAPVQQCPPVQANVTCGYSQTLRRGPQPYHRPQQHQSCGHCRSVQKKKKCVIQ